MKTLSIVVLAAALSGCVTEPRHDPMSAVASYISANRPLAQSGELKWSHYYTQLYDVVRQTNPPGGTLERVNIAIRLSQMMEAGQISKEEYSFQMRNLDAQNRTTLQQQEEQHRNQQIRDIATAAQLMQSSATYTLQQRQEPRELNVLKGFLQSQAVNGSLRYCRYSNGVVTTISAVSLCPMESTQ